MKCRPNQEEAVIFGWSHWLISLLLLCLSNQGPHGALKGHNTVTSLWRTIKQCLEENVPRCDTAVMAPRQLGRESAEAVDTCSKDALRSRAEEGSLCLVLPQLYPEN